jgi:DNA repair protein SbcC/Rad50
VRLRRLRLNWFRLFDDVAFDFRTGLNVVTGGNGAGKSTLLEGIAWALYGAGAVRRSEASLLATHAPSGTCTAAVLEFEAGGVDHCVHRTTGEGCATAVLLSGDEVVARDGAAVTAAVSALLGADRDAMLHACATGRRELQQLTQLAPVERLRLLARLLGHAPPPPADSPLDDAVHALQQELADADERMAALGSAPELLNQLSAELDRMQPDLAAVEALTERLHDEWSQKRQDVDTKLAAYRARGDELRLQIERLAGEGAAAKCPSCGHALGAALDRMLDRLDDEAYVNAQDSKWLVQRQAQLTRKPTDLLDAETRRARLRAAVDDRRERAARCEQAAQELWNVASERKRTAERLRSLQQEIRNAPPPPMLPPPSLRRSEVRAVIDLASDFVRSVTDAGYEGVTLHPDGRIHALCRGSEVPVVSGGDEDLIALSLRLAAMRTRTGHGLQLMLLDEPFAGLDARRRRRALECVRALLPEFPQILLCTRDADAAASADHDIRL